MLIEYPLERISAQDLHRVALRSKGQIDRLFLHWTAGHYHQAYDDYHVNISGDGNVFLTCDELTDDKTHTECHNSRAIGIALDCAVGAELKNAFYPGDVNFGKEPPTLVQIETLCKVIAVLTDALDIEILEDTVTTHAEIANKDGYGPTRRSHKCEWRWDLWFVPYGKGKKDFILGGKYLRDKARWYRENYFTKIFDNEGK